MKFLCPSLSFPSKITLDHTYLLINTFPPKRCFSATYLIHQDACRFLRSVHTPERISNTGASSSLTSPNCSLINVFNLSSFAKAPLSVKQNQNVSYQCSNQDTVNLKTNRTTILTIHGSFFELAESKELMIFPGFFLTENTLQVHTPKPPHAQIYGPLRTI